MIISGIELLSAGASLVMAVLSPIPYETASYETIPYEFTQAAAQNITGESEQHAIPTWCYPQQGPKLNMVPVTDDIQFVYSESSANLGHYDINTISPYNGLPVKQRVGGISEGRITKLSTYGVRSISDLNANMACLSYDDINVTFHIKPTVYIAKENQPGTCKHNAIKEHELKHVRIDREMVNKYLDLLGKAIHKDMVENGYVIGPVPVDQIYTVQNQMRTRMDKMVNIYFTAMQAERLQRQQKLDNRQEYERVSKACP